MENFDRNSQNSSKRKYYLSYREKILNKKRIKYQELNSIEKRKISKRNKSIYNSKSVSQKKVLSLFNQEKYRNMSDEQRLHLKFKNRKKYMMLTAAQKLKLKYKNLMHRLKNKQFIDCTNLRNNEKFSKMATCFVDCIKEGPTEICECCGGLFFKKSIKSISSNYFQNNFDGEMILNFLCVPSMVSFFTLFWCNRI